MTSQLSRWLGVLAGLGSAILFWFLGSVLSAPVRAGQLLHLGRAGYELIAFLIVPASVLAALALFWVPGHPDNIARVGRASRVRLLLVLIFLGAFLLGFAR
ncbi:MAG TPA: hypothetical protein VF772_22125 [Terriglobales bacterium]